MADFQAMIKTELIGKDLLATAQKMKDATCYAIMPKTLKDDSGLALDEAMEQIAEFVQGITKSETPPFQAEDIKDALKAFVDISQVKLILRQAYLFIKNHSKEEDKEKNITEYAFNVAVTFEDGQIQEAKGSLFKVKELSFALWSCDRQLILDSMDILDLSDIDKAIENVAALEEKRSKAAAAIEQKQDEEVVEEETAPEEEGNAAGNSD
ncbi:MAG: hypothetical protein NC412_04255 [Roseburia sp.]|nr:hypothetical protein [Roseburia sp.]MCM1278116.1 hypothetical protein [Robinsoniella sp.]